MTDAELTIMGLCLICIVLIAVSRYERYLDRRDLRCLAGILLRERNQGRAWLNTLDLKMVDRALARLKGE